MKNKLIGFLGFLIAVGLVYSLLPKKIEKTFQQIIPRGKKVEIPEDEYTPILSSKPTKEELKKQIADAKKAVAGRG